VRQDIKALEEGLQNLQAMYSQSQKEEDHPRHRSPSPGRRPRQRYPYDNTSRDQRSRSKSPSRTALDQMDRPVGHLISQVVARFSAIFVVSPAMVGAVAFNTSACHSPSSPWTGLHRMRHNPGTVIIIHLHFSRTQAMSHTPGTVIK
jgi:hypothetical protein